MGLQLCTLDFETYYSSKDGYTLKKMTPEEYIRDPRFQIILVSLKFNDGSSFWISGDHEYLKRKLSQIAWNKVIALGHNMAGFDSLVLTEVLGMYPAFWQCTLCIGRALHGGGSVSLDNLAKRYLLSKRKGTEVERVDGMRREDFTAEQLKAYGEYSCDDTDICYTLYQIMRPHMPPRELRQVHLFTRMFAEPKVALDKQGLELLQHQLAIQKQRLLDQCGVDQKQLRSDQKFAELLEGLGVQPGTKLNKNGDTKYAFAKTDRFMKDLEGHEDERVRMLVSARLKTKTTIEESRVARFLGIAERGLLPAMLNYGKTLTHRASGGGGVNLQNLNNNKPVTEETVPGALLATDWGRQTFKAYDEEADQVYTDEGDVINQKDETRSVHVYGMRDALMAPEGYEVVACDSSNIELRVAHLLAGQMDTIERIRNGEDLYCWFAGDLYGRTITKGDKKERNHGKVGMLQLQFQSGAGSFQQAARVLGGIFLSMEESQQTVDLFRAKFPMLPKIWYRCQDAISDMYHGRVGYIDQWGLCHTEHNAVVLPNGMRLHYNNLRREFSEDFGWQWVFDDKETGKPKKLYGGSLFANMVQAIARIVVFDQTLLIEQRWGNYQTHDEGVALIVHDEAVAIIRADRSAEAEKDMVSIMSQPPKWWPQLPVKAEGGRGRTYGDAK